MAASKELGEALARVPLFEGLDRKELAHVLRGADEVDHPAGKHIVEEGGGGAGFHLILSGEAVVTKNGREVRRLVKGDYFGEIALLDEGPRSATVAATTPVHTLSIVAWNFLPLLEEHPAIARHIVGVLCSRLREVEAKLEAAGLLGEAEAVHEA